ncbi:MAG: hypothetical protein M1498_01660 [Candidatus Thermoplasmatota archaeon]|nr:hypothetical protein [Candidatus Thermoplasmatota archaeon]MCL5888911.1 hypothetical protein [Candidatus Thermoplasmatota archaeon]
MKSSFNISEKSQRIIIELNYNTHEVVKTSLSKVIPNSYALNRHLEELEDLGLINVRKEKIVRVTFYISLTDKGKLVAEQLLNADLAARGTFKRSFFSRSQQILMFLGTETSGKATVSQIKEAIPGSYDDLKELQEMKLISSEIDNKAYSPVNYINLTEKGEEMMKKLEECENMVKR